MMVTGDIHPAFESLAIKPRAHLTETVTLLQPMTNLTEQIGGAALFVKRDDLLPLAMGGNKVRQLEYYFGEALAAKADTVLITGAVQSNFVRLAAAAARKLKMHCHVQLEERVANDSREYRHSGNVLLDRLLGATIHSFADGEDEAGADANLEQIAEELRGEGKTPYVIHLGVGHPPVGSLGYVDAAIEIVAQLESSCLDISRIVVASGSGATHTGLLFGLRLLNVDIPVTGVCVRRDATQQRSRISSHARGIAQLLGCDNPVADSDILLDDRFLAPGYGKAGAAARQAIQMAAHHEALLVDPVYTAKALAGAIDIAKDDANGRILFIHTGGTPAVFGYADAMLEACVDE
ncbi:MAG: D-cysteine desulfhydrase [marine bacterium B5-7]|nr:MAG: D-cysteine desulfhydrase [marine bacterium B5-7]